MSTGFELEEDECTGFELEEDECTGFELEEDECIEDKETNVELILEDLSLNVSHCYYVINNHSSLCRRLI